MPLHFRTTIPSTHVEIGPRAVGETTPNEGVRQVRCARKYGILPKLAKQRSRGDHSRAAVSV